MEDKVENQQQALVSIIVPVYKVEKELSRCVESLVQQDYAHCEIILVDDGSPDRSGEIADELAAKYPQVCVIHQQNKGLSGARNRGIREAKGRYLSFIDSDDFVEPNMISLMVGELERSSSDIAVCGRFDDYPDHSRAKFTMNEVTVLPAEEVIKRILTWDQMDVSACDKLFKAELWKDIAFPEGENNEDIRTVPTVISRADRIVHVALPFYHYCHRENSITTTYNQKKIKDFYNAVRHMEGFVEKNYPQLKDALVYYVNHSYMSLIMMCGQIGYRGTEKDTARQYLKANWNQPYSLGRMSKSEKFFYFLIRCHIYDAYKQLKRFLQARK